MVCSGWWFGGPCVAMSTAKSYSNAFSELKIGCCHLYALFVSRYRMKGLCSCFTLSIARARAPAVCTCLRWREEAGGRFGLRLVACLGRSAGRKILSQFIDVRVDPEAKQLRISRLASSRTSLPSFVVFLPASILLSRLHPISNVACFNHIDHLSTRIQSR